MRSKPAPRTPDESLRGVSHVFFDVGGTILHPEPGAPEVFRKVLARRGHAVNRESIRRTLRSPEGLVSLIRPLERERAREYYRHVNARALEHLGFESDGSLLDAVGQAFGMVVWRPYPETLAVLQGLRTAGYHLGVVSNASHQLPVVLARCGLGDFFETVTVSVEVGAEKPDPRIFRRAIAQAGTTPERSLHVGDQYDADYLGARQAGLHALMLLRRGNPPEPCPTIRSLAEVLALLDVPRSRP